MLLYSIHFSSSNTICFKNRMFSLHLSREFHAVKNIFFVYVEPKHQSDKHSKAGANSCNKSLSSCSWWFCFFPDWTLTVPSCWAVPSWSGKHSTRMLPLPPPPPPRSLPYTPLAAPVRPASFSLIELFVKKVCFLLLWKDSRDRVGSLVLISEDKWEEATVFQASRRC